MRIPERASVHEAVEVCSALGVGWAKSFVNAILRAHLRQPASLPPGDSAAALATRYSHPEWMVDRYLKRYGAVVAKQLLERNNRKVVRFFRWNPFRTDLERLVQRLDEAGVEFERSYLPSSLIIRSKRFSQHPIYRQGLGFFMDPASQEAIALLPVKGRSQIADFCAAPGNKTFCLASRLDPGAGLFAFDSSCSRISSLAGRQEVCGIPKIHFAVMDASRPTFPPQTFDAILLDVPCSGTGTVRSNPDLRWIVQESHLKRNQQTQLAILKGGLKSLRPGGELLYITCSTEPEENEQVIEKGLQRYPAARLIGDYFRTYPRDHLGDGFFAARIRHN